jgi:hypothetical protein
MHLIRAPLQAQIVQWLVQPGDLVQADALLVVLGGWGTSAFYTAPRWRARHKAWS